MTAADVDAPVAMIDRVALILDAFNGPAHLTLAQVVAQTGLPRSSAHRILEHLVRIRWLCRDEGSYSLGLGVLEARRAGRAPEPAALRRAAVPA